MAISVGTNEQEPIVERRTIIRCGQVGKTGISLERSNDDELLVHFDHASRVTFTLDEHYAIQVLVARGLIELAKT